jgi:shikimate kinase / 3-dehydroquinate synthase
MGKFAPFIFLYGPPGSGKSECGRALAENLALPFYDLDREIEARTGMTISQLFAGVGEPGFRERERAALESLLERSAGVVALGGGALLDPRNRARVEARGQVVCLHASPERLLERLESASGPRPLLSGGGQEFQVEKERLEALLEVRAQHYASFERQLDTSDLTVEGCAWSVQVQLGAFHVRGMGPGYDVRVAAGGLPELGVALERRGLGGPVVIASDENVGRFYGATVVRSLQAAGFTTHLVLFPPGEQHKNVQTVKTLWDAFLEAGLERGSTVVALGGGVVGDLAGFAAASFLRGVPWVAVPTSLLAMVDAGLGGKTGVDLPQGKNLVGAFHPPRLVLADPDVLATLPGDELRAALAEVVKAGLVADPNLFSLCSRGWPALEGCLDEVIRRAMAVKIGVIEADPFERGLRAVLNAGHSIGHAVEQASGFSLRHGEAVAIGLVHEARLAERLGLAEPGLGDRIRDTLLGLGLPVEIPAGLDEKTILAALRLDKKRQAGTVRFALPIRIGEVRYGVEVEQALVL